MELANAAIDQHEERERLLFRLQPRVAPPYDLPHCGKVVIGLLANDELPIGALFHPPVLPNHHRGDDFGALRVRDVEALDAVVGLLALFSGREI